MKRWKIILTAAMLIVITQTGCPKLIYTDPATYSKVLKDSLPPDLDRNPNVAEAKQFDRDTNPPPATVETSLNVPKRFMTLQEAMAIALESGTRPTGLSSVISGILRGVSAALVFSDEAISNAGGGSLVGDDSIKAFALDPAIAGADIEGALAKFDARWLSSMQWQKQDQAIQNTFQSLQNGDTANLSTGIYKPLPTGGTTSITYETNYQKLSNVANSNTFQVVNPSYTPSLTFNFEQPLLQNFGVEINELLPSHPSSLLTPSLLPSGGRSNGILITRIHSDEARYEFQRNVHVMLFAVEVAYWNLYAAYFAHYAADQAVRQSYATWKLTDDQFKAGTRTRAEPAQAAGQLYSFRSSKIIALSSVLEAERQLRGVLGLPLEDGKRIIPADKPTLAPFIPDWYTGLNEMEANRPELNMCRQDIRVNQLNVLLQQNNTRPNLTFAATYNVNSIGTSLNGSTDNALRNLAANNFNSWTTELRLDVPLGTRDAHAALRTAQLNLARSFRVYSNQRDKAQKFLGANYQAIYQSQRLIEVRRGQREEFGKQVETQYERFKTGKDPLLVLLQAQSDFATALQSEHQAIANYNIALAGWQFAKGSILTYNNVRIADNAFPDCSLARAVDYYKARTDALILREREQVPTENGPYFSSVPASVPAALNQINLDAEEDIKNTAPIRLPNTPGTPGTYPAPLPPLPGAPISSSSRTPTSPNWTASPGGAMPPMGTTLAPSMAPAAPLYAVPPAPPVPGQ